MSVKQARRYLGKHSQHLTDLQVIELVRQLTDIAEYALKKTVSKPKITD